MSGRHAVLDRIAANARAVAEFMDSLPGNAEAPSHLNIDQHRQTPEVQWLMFGDEGDQRARAAALVRAIGGTWDKAQTGDLFRFKSAQSGVRLEIVVNREQVCTARVVGQETVTKKIPATFDEITETVDVVEWDCAPLLAEVAS